MKQPFTSLWLALAVLAFLPTVPTVARDLSSVWVARRGKWVSGPPVTHGLRVATATILYFEEGGGLAIIEATINKNASGTTISEGDGYAVYSGSWSEEGSKIRMHYHLLYKTLKLPGENVPGPDRDQVGRIFQAGNHQVLELSGRRFLPDATIRTAELNQIVSSSQVLSKSQ